MDENLFKQRTKQLALRIIKIVEALPKNRTAEVLGRQLIRIWYFDRRKLSSVSRQVHCRCDRQV